MNCYQRLLCTAPLLLALAASGCSSPTPPAATGSPGPGAPPVAVSSPAPQTGAIFTAVFGTTVAKKPAGKALAKAKGKTEVTIYLYSFPAQDTWPDAKAYTDDDFFLDVTIKAPKDGEIKPGEFKGEQLSPTLHTKKMNYGFLKDRGAIRITAIEGGKIKGEFDLDDGHVKFKGPFEMDLL